jgi:hypothetical protein
MIDFGNYLATSLTRIVHYKKLFSFLVVTKAKNL